jgi:hypothetical protein
LRQLVIKWVALSHTVWVDRQTQTYYSTLDYFYISKCSTPWRWKTLVDVCQASAELNRFSVMLLLTSRHALICIHRPARCQHWVLLRHRNNTWLLSSFPSLHISQCTGHCTPWLLNLNCVGNTFQPILQRRFFTFGGIFAPRIKFQLAATPCLFCIPVVLHILPIYLYMLHWILKTCDSIILECNWNGIA